MINELRKLEDKGLITLREHNDLPLLIANYTPEVQYERLWDEHELIKQCRGLIVDTDGNVIARTFPKFFNIEEHKEFDSLPDIPYGEHHVVYDKLDGSLGIVYWYEDEWRVATRGSFHSDQADKARELLGKYDVDKLNTDFTYLVEIIYPENRIVVDYGDKEELILVAMIRTVDGAEPINLDLERQRNCFPVVSEAPFNIHALEQHENELNKFRGEDKEGFVIHFNSGLRIKVKLEDYVRLHRLMTGLTKRKVWELLRDGEDLDELYKTAPDEVYDWIKETADELIEEWFELYDASLNSFRDIVGELESPIERKDFAKKVMTNDKLKKLNLTSIMFSLLDNKNIDDKLWKLVYPEHEPINTQDNE